jgi:hypothetical protein
MAGYWTGLLEGFQGQREAGITRSLEQDAQRRQQESKIYEYLLNSRDPEIQSMALAGMFESGVPGSKKKGLSGFMGELEGSQVYPKIRALMDQMVPDDGVGGGPAPPQPGSASMSTNQPVHDGSAPIQLAGAELPPEPPPPGVAAAPPGQAGELPDMGAMGPPPAPPVSRFKRRGTGIPTAEEIAESNAAAARRGSLGAGLEAFRSAQNPDEQRIVAGMLGSPEATPSFGAEPDNAILPDGTVVPVTRNVRTGQVINGFTGEPLPPGSKMQPRQTGGGALSSFLEDSAESRQYLISQGADPTVVNAGSPSGAWEYRRDGAGRIILNASEFTQPPAYGGTFNEFDPMSPTGRSVVPINRGGGRGPALGNAPPVAGDVMGPEADAKAFLQLINRAIAQAENATSPVASLRKKLTPQQIDQLVVQQARSNGLPYTRYFEVQRAAQGATAGGEAAAPGTSIADRILRRLQQGDQAQPPPPPAQRPPARSGGAAPQRPPRP